MGFVIRAHSQVRFQFSTRGWWFRDFSACCVLVENHFSIWKIHTPKPPIGRKFASFPALVIMIWFKYIHLSIVDLSPSLYQFLIKSDSFGVVVLTKCSARCENYFFWDIDNNTQIGALHSIALSRLENKVPPTPLLHSELNSECSRGVGKTLFLCFDRVMECPVLCIMCTFYAIALVSSFQTWRNVIILTFPRHRGWDLVTYTVQHWS